MKNPKPMTFSPNVDTTEAKAEHKLYFSFSKDYLEGKKVLDVGSWTGPFEVLIYNTADEITAVDIEGEALKVLKKNLPKVKCVKAPSDKLPFENSSFDVATFWDVIEHVPLNSEVKTLKEIGRVLKKGGYLFLATPHKNFWSDLFDPAYFVAGHRHYTHEQLSDYLKKAGFQIEEVIRRGSFFTSFYSLSFYFFKHILRRKMPEIKWVEDKNLESLMSPGYIQIMIRAKKIS